MSNQKVLLVALLCLMVTVAWSLPSQTLNMTETATSKRQLIKDFVAKVQELIILLVKQLQELSAKK
ncbi:uncharacterized protein LOC108149920 [Drosophila elegans]|uniref:uncharacterized protein LOC108149920 n=1 Tax=Drosophila elegans TaxID=30023 RepID=UPI0007E5C4E7|nr:uncharacterized protein LOC108149920 [Drosophila elegans]